MKHPQIDFRKDHYWHMGNFNAAAKLPRSTFLHAMSRMQKTEVITKLPGNLGTELYYQIADKFCSGREGHCFGMSVAAVKEWHGQEHLTKQEQLHRDEDRFLEKSGRISEIREFTPELKENILKLHLKQIEPDYLGYVVRLFSKRLLFASKRSMKFIADLIDREGCVLVNVVDVKKLAGHTVVAYDYRKVHGSGEYIIYIADSNHPWKPGESDPLTKTTRHPSYIRMLSYPDGRKKAGLYYRNHCEGKYDVVFGVPYKNIK